MKKKEEELIKLEIENWAKKNGLWIDKKSEARIDSDDSEFWIDSPNIKKGYFAYCSEGGYVDYGIGFALPEKVQSDIFNKVFPKPLRDLREG